MKSKKDNAMRKSIWSVFLTLVTLTLLVGGCAPAATLVPPTISPSPISPTFTAEPTETVAPIPSSTPLPGVEVIPLEKLGTSLPWLPLDQSARPSTYFFFFNLSKPPFDNVLVRQAFAAAIDREALVKVAQGYGVKDAHPATTFTPSQTLGRDLYNEIGIPFDPAHAKDLLAKAGYTDTSQFPQVTLLIGVEDTSTQGFHDSIAKAMVDLWQQYLGIKITIERLDNKTFFDRIVSNPTEIFRLIIYAKENNDPDIFLPKFHTGAQNNYGGFSNPEFDQLVELAAKSNDPAKRQELYIQAERILCETETAVLPIYHATFP
jgi:ABC-type transport system substrate-binding protein